MSTRKMPPNHLWVFHQVSYKSSIWPSFPSGGILFWISLPALPFLFQRLFKQWLCGRQKIFKPIVAVAEQKCHRNPKLGHCPPTNSQKTDLNLNTHKKKSTTKSRAEARVQTQGKFTGAFPATWARPFQNKGRYKVKKKTTGKMWLSKTQNRSAAAASLRKESHITASSRPFCSGGRLSLCSQMWICRASFCCRQVFALQPDVKLQVFLLLQTVFCFTARSGTAVLLFDWREAATGQQLHLQLWTFCSGCLPQVFQTPRAT